MDDSDAENTSRDQHLVSLLTDALMPDALEVINESHLHHGHQGSPGTGASHYKIVIQASVLNGLSRVAAHRLINDAVASEFDTGLHALSIKISTQA